MNKVGKLILLSNISNQSCSKCACDPTKMYILYSDIYTYFYNKYIYINMHMHMHISNEITYYYIKQYYIAFESIRIKIIINKDIIIKGNLR